MVLFQVFRANINNSFRIIPKLNVIMRLVFELVNYDFEVQHLNHNTKETSLKWRKDIAEKNETFLFKYLWEVFS